MPQIRSLTRRGLARLGLGLLGAAPLALHAVSAPPPRNAENDAPATLLPSQRLAYKKACSVQSRQAAHLHQFALGYGYEPDFIYSALSPASRRQARRKS